MQLFGAGPPAHAWVVIGSDATIVAADTSACLLFEVHTSANLIGQSCTTLVAPGDGATIMEAVDLVRSGRSWQGLLHRRGHIDEPPIDVEMAPTDAAGGVALMHIRASNLRPTASRGAPPADDNDNDNDTLMAQVAALEAIVALPEPSSASRGVLGALRATVNFDWGAVLRFVGDSQHRTVGAEVVAVYPAPMAGVDRRVQWAPLDPAQAGVQASGEPEYARMIGGEPGAQSPLRRLAAFGMNSRIHVPLFDGPLVVGCLVVYTSGQPLDLHDGIAIERVSRSLGPLLGPPAGPAATHDDVTPPPARSVPPLPTPMPEPASDAPLAYRPAADTMLGAAQLAASASPTTRLSALSEVISGVAHELNNPLTAILGYAQIFHALDGTERDQAVKTIEREAQRAARIVRNLLSFARQEPARTSSVDVEEILRRVIEVMQYSLEVDNVRTELRFAGVPEVDADQGQLEQVFLNLVNNAQQALQPGGGEIVITTSDTDGYLRVSVADNGPGVPAEMRDRVFEPFFTTHDEGSGQGMGLSTVYGAGHAARRTGVGGAVGLRRGELHRGAALGTHGAEHCVRRRARHDVRRAAAGRLRAHPGRR